MRYDFKDYAKDIEQRFNKMAEGELFVLDISPDTVWEFYLDAFPEGTNEIFRERRAYDCSCCKQFVRNIGNIVTIEDGTIKTVWDVPAGSYYTEVSKKVNEMLQTKTIKTKFLHKENKFGAKVTQELPENGELINWNHFYCVVPSKFINKEPRAALTPVEAKYQVASRGLKELSIESVEIVEDLILQNSLYRGEEAKKAVSSFLGLKKTYDNLSTDVERSIFVWENLNKQGIALRNSVVGTLLQDLSEGKDLTSAIKSYDVKVAPSNYKRTSAPVTKGMIQAGLDKIKELGIESALQRRFARLGDISVNNVLYADRSISPLMQDSLESLLMSGAKTTPPKLDKAEDITIDDFINNVLPKNIDSLEVLVKNNQIGNFVSLIAPNDMEAKNILDWDNNFSWSYNGDITDSMREAVVSAGGRVDGAFRFTHSWNELEPNQSLMDLHVFMPGNPHRSDDKAHNTYGSGRRVGWNARTDRKSGGSQDVDYTSQAPAGYVPIENITFPDISKMPEGKYICKIHNWDYRKSGGKGRAEIEFNGEVFQYEYPATKHHQWITVAEVTLKDGVFTIEHKLPTSTSSKDVWGIKTEEFIKVSSVMMSPNHWDGQAKGNRHYMFMLDGCKNPENARGLYNEFLTKDLQPHRKVFDLLADKMKCEAADDQLSGIGFSSTKRDELIVRVKGSFNRILNIKF